MPYTGSLAVAGQGSQLQQCTSTNGTYASPTTISEILEFQGTGAKADTADTTNMDSTSAFHEKLQTLLDSGEVTFKANLITTSTSQAELVSDFNGRVRRDYQILFPNGTSKIQFQGFVSGLDFDFPVEKQITWSGKITITGPRTYTP